MAISLKAGKTNVTVKSPGLFACETITFAEPFSGGKQVKVFASFGHSVNNKARGNGAAIMHGLHDLMGNDDKSLKSESISVSLFSERLIQ